MSVAYLTITILTALSSGAAAVANLTGHSYPKKEADRLQISHRWIPVLGTLLGAAAAGLLIGIAVPIVGVLASGGLFLYFIGALIAHLRVRDLQLGGWAVLFVLSTAALVVNVLRL